MKQHYLYVHIRPDKNEIFYVGIGTKYSSNRYDRAYDFRSTKRNNIWTKIFNKNSGIITVDIIKEFDCLEDCTLLEKQYIKQLGKIYDGSGQLANIGDGGEYCNYSAVKILQYDLSGKYIQTWTNVYEIEYELNIRKSSIYGVASGRFTKSNGFIWKYYKDNFPLQIKPIVKNRNSKKVYQIKDNKVINIFPSAYIAGQKTKIDRSSIINTALGKRKSAGGYIWKYQLTG